MDLLPIGFLIFIVAMSGCIAVLADEVGRRIGKKRLKIGKLRPKRVAQIGTATAGITVSILTIMIVAAASSGVRQWIAEGRRAITKLQAANEQLAEQEKKLKLGETQFKLAEDQNKALNLTNKTLGNTANQLKRDIAKQKENVARVRLQLGSLRSQYASLLLEQGRANERLRIKQAALDSNRRTLAQQQERLARLNQRMSSVQAKLKVAILTEKEAVKQTSEAVDANNKLNVANRELETRVDALKTQIAGLESDRDKAEIAAQDAKTKLTTAESDLKTATEELANVTESLTSAQLQAQRLAQINGRSRTAPPIYLLGDEVARISVEPGLSMEKAQAAVDSLLRTARLEALAKGAKPNGIYPEAGIFEHTDSRTGHTFTRAEIEREIVSKLAGAKDPQVLVALSSFNAFKGEPVSLEVDCVPNPLVYHRNEVVAEARLDGRKEPSTILGEISALGDRVRQRAMDDKMLPRATQELSESLGQDKIWKLLNDVKRSGGFVSIRAVADSDIRAGDPLRVRFVVR